MGIRRLQQTFAGGELTPSMYGRFDISKYSQGLATCLNFVVLPQGPVKLRSGTTYVNATKYSNKKCRLIPFMFSLDQTMALEFGDKYIRFHTDGQTLMNGSSIYEIETPYTEDDIFDLHYIQSMDVMTIVHPSYPPKELKRLGATNWTLTDIDFSEPIKPPTISSVTYSVVVSDGTTVTDEEKERYTLKYKVTAIKDTDYGVQESTASAIGSCKGNLYLNNSLVTITWSAVSGADRYRVYKNYKGLYGYIGETEDTTFDDDNYMADESVTPPIYETPFGSTDNYPSAVTYYQQRRCFAGTNNLPQYVWMTRPGTESEMIYTLPTQSDNRVKFGVAAQEASRIMHLMPLQQLIALTNTTEYRIAAGSGYAISPDDIDAKVQACIGASSVQPVIVNSTLVYAAARGHHVRELGYNWQISGYTTGDVSLYSSHLFEDNEVVDMALSKAPDSVIWCAMKDGSLLGCTYLPEQQICGWHRHRTINGEIESVTTVIEGDEDIVYLVVKRTINGSTVRYVERMHERFFAELKDAYHVDCGGIYEGNPTTTVTGLTWLEGETVNILADGCVLPQQVVTNGQITLAQEASKVIVGLPITADFQTLPSVYQQQDGSYATGHMKNVNDVYIRVVDSSGVFIGPDFDNLVEVKQRTGENYGSPPDLMDREISVMTYCQWSVDGQICLRQVDPLPLTIVSLSIDLAQ